MLAALLEEAKTRHATPAAAAADDESSADAGGPVFNIGTLNEISSDGLGRFPSSRYAVEPQDDGTSEAEVHALMLRSYKLKSDEVANSVRAVGRCGAGTNNIPVGEMTARGIPVFNAPGANANAVKELVLTALLLASRGIVEGHKHMDSIFEEESDPAVCKKRVESEKKLFVGNELMGKTLGVVGLGHIGASVARCALDLGMKVIGYDPAISLEAAWMLPGDRLKRASQLDDLLANADYVSLHTPYMPATHHLLDDEKLALLKPTAHLVNFARAELVDSAALRKRYESGAHVGKYVADFADHELYGHERVLLLPHLGASTAEAESNSAAMIADQLIDFIETGSIVNSVNFPRTVLEQKGEGVRMCIATQNVSGMLGQITTAMGDSGLNITQQINTSRDDIAYNVVDFDTVNLEKVEEVASIVSHMDGVLSTRALPFGSHRTDSPLWGPTAFTVSGQ